MISEKKEDPTPMTEAEIEEVEKRARAATEGPWRFVIEDAPDGTVRSPGDNHVADCHSGNGPFIAHARADIPRLLATIRERDKVIAELRAQIDRMHAWMPHHD